MSTDGASGQPDEEPDRPREGRRAGKPADHHVSAQNEPETRTRQEYYDVLASGRGYEIASFAALMAERPASERPEWEIPLRRGEIDRCGLGVIDERAKTFSAAERRIAERLADPGPAVVSVSEGFGIYGRTSDARVNGIPVEFKSLDPGASDRTVKAALNSAKGQARHAVIDARDSGLTEEQAHRGIRRFSGTPHGNRLDAVLVIGDNYTIDWKRAC
jgi:Contact-dependent growth inhibition CdiA C-terminal domain